jgi:phosphonate degradation associated HDIG domain protein
MSETKRATRVDDALRLFAKRGNSQYGGENVSQLEHALQAAFFAERQGASANLISAALLHDVGHLLHALPDDAPAQGIDDAHEELAARWLASRFGPAVCEPVRMHVLAKRYLCAVDDTYHAQLSAPSQQSLELQGGVMSAAEARALEAQPFAQDAVQLRRWDDAAKVIGLKTPDIDYYARFLAMAD